MPSSVLNSDDGVISGTSGIKSTGGDDGVLLIQTNGTTAQTVDAGQRTMFPTTIGVGGATPSTSGSGITFPATQSASSNANTLDDYEEGTWTPSLGGNATYTNRSASYTKIGRLVFIQLFVQVNTIGTGSTTTITGLPFVCSDADQGGFSIGYSDSIATSSVSYASIRIQGNPSELVLQLKSTASTGSGGEAYFGNSTRVRIAGCYTT